MDMMIAHATDVPPSFKDIGLGRQIPSIIEDVVMRCLEKDPNRRPQCARDLAEEYETAVAIVESGMESKLENQPPPGMQKPVDPLAFVQDPTTIAYVMEAWMPESIALIKLRGYASDNYGNVLESVPGHIRLEINPGAPPRSSWSSLFGRKPEHLNVELNLRNADTGRANNLFIQVVFRPNHISQLQDPVWRSRCSSAFVELRSYLMGK
jgi:serine/threonine-protein kinase